MRRHSLSTPIPALCVWLSVALAGSVAAATAPTKQTFMVPMRDGIHLATDVYRPAGGGPWPVALVRTPYNKDDYGSYLASAGSLFPAAQFSQSGIVLVIQDTRGRYASEGRARPYLDDGWGDRQDGLDTMAWLHQQSWFNGKAATFGTCYLGNEQLLLAGAGAEGIVGQIVTGGVSSIYHYDWFQGGVWRQGMVEYYLDAYGWPSEVLTWVHQHPRYDASWATVDLGSRPDQVRWPVALIGGWYDFSLRGTLAAYAELQDHGGAGGAGQAHLLIGPWNHGGEVDSELPGFDRMTGELRFPKNAVYPPDAPTQMQWLRYWLMGQPAAPASEPAVRYYVMGDVTDPQAPGNIWRTADRWPPPSQPLRLYFTPDGRLDLQPPATMTTRGYDYDPLRPAPSIGLDWDAVDDADAFGAFDQRRAEDWPDVLLFTTPPLAQPLEVTGRVTVHLSAATTARDTDFTAKLTDVYPDGRSMLVTDGIIRGSYRNSVEKAEFLTPSQRYAFDIDVGSTSLIFNKGHRLRVAISSSDYPRFEINRNNGYSWPEDQNHPSAVAHQTIFLGGTDGSFITLPQATGSP